MNTITPRPYISPADPLPVEQATYQVPQANISEAETVSELNIFALLRQLAALLQEINSANQHQKIRQSLHQLELHIASAHAIREIGGARNSIGWAKAEGIITVGLAALIPQLPQILHTNNPNNRNIFTGLHAIWAALPQITGAQTFPLYSQAAEGVISIWPQATITDNEALNKEADACIQSTHAAIDSITKQIDQFTQMLRELITQTIKEIHTSHHQALSAMLSR